MGLFTLEELRWRNNGKPLNDVREGGGRAVKALLRFEKDR